MPVTNGMVRTLHAPAQTLPLGRITMEGPAELGVPAVLLSVAARIDTG